MQRTMTYEELKHIFNIYEKAVVDIEKKFLDGIFACLVNKFSEAMKMHLSKPVSGKIADHFFKRVPNYNDMVQKPLDNIRKSKPKFNGTQEEVDYYEFLWYKLKLSRIGENLNLWHNGSITLDDDELNTFKWLANVSLERK